MKPSKFKSLCAQVTSGISGLAIANYFLLGNPQAAIGWTICAVAILAISHNIE